MTTHFNIGGITNYILSLSRALGAKNVHTIVSTSGGDMEKELSLSGIPHRKLDMDTKFEFGPKVLKSAFRIAHIIRSERIDIVHAHTRVSQVACRLASSMTGVPYVTTCHGYFRKRMRGVFDTWGSKVIAISEAVKSHLRSDLGVDIGRIEVIYNGVDTARFLKRYPEDAVRDLKKALDLGRGPVIGTIGRLSSVKGQKFLIGAMPRIISDMPEARAIIVGDGPEAEDLKNLARSLHVDRYIRFVPGDSDTPKFLALMDVFVFPSVNEGLGLSLLEAMAYGLPCVASEVGGIIDIIKSASCGMLVPIGDKEAIAGAALKLLNDPALRLAMGKNGRSVVMEKFSLDNMADRILRLYKDILK